ncbi:MAG: hypothetical protein ACTHOD_04090 [Motilibacteraceae bacterium]
MTERPDLPADGAPVPAAGPAVPDDPWSADALVDRLLHDDVDAAVSGSPLAGLVHALRGPATADALAGESAAVAAVLAAVELEPGGSVTSPTDREERPRSRRRIPVLSTLIASKLAFGAAAAAAVTLGGTAAAAYTGTLPTGLQKVASQTIGAPAPATVVAADVSTPAVTESSDPEQTESSDPTETATDTPSTEATDEATDEAKGPDATGPAAFGLCTAFLRGGLHNPSSTAYQALVAAAAGKATAAPTETATDGSTPTETATASTAADPTTSQTAAAGDDAAVTTYCEGVLGARATAKASSSAKHGKSAEHHKSEATHGTEATEAPEPEATESTEAQDGQTSEDSSSHGRSGDTEHGQSGSHRGSHD